MSILFCDIDHFKLLNDIHGHPTGDLVLREVGSTISKTAGKDGAVFRYDSEEFIAILSGCFPKDANNKAEQIRIEVGNMKGLKVEKYNAHVTISIGLASYPGDALSIEGLIEKAETSAAATLYIL